MLSDAEIIRRLKIIRYSERTLRNARKAPSINGLAEASSLSRMHLYRLATGWPLTPRARRELSRVMTCHTNERERA